MAIDAKYIPLSYFQEYFINKANGAPLTDGIVRFYKDQDRLEPKEVFVLSGNPPDYTYTSIGSEVTLSSIGTTSYNNNDVTVYLYPYDEEGNVERYYATVDSEGEVRQFTREGFPNIASGADQEENIINYIPNGQFLVHYDLPATDDYEAGEIRAAETILAPGGWSFKRPGGSGATDFVTFERFTAVTNPDGNPNFSVRIRTTIPSAGDTYKDIRIKFRDVDRFASEDQQYTFSLAGKSNTGGNSNVSLILIKNYGTDGDPEEEIPLTTFTLTTSYTQQDYPFVYGTNDGKTIELDSYTELAIRFPTNITNDVSLTNFLSTLGNINITFYPEQTTSDTLTRSVAGCMPTPEADGSTLYLKPIQTKDGLGWDDSCIGDILAESQTSGYVDSLHPTTNRMLADGNKYITTDYSPLGIPFSRLQNKYWIDSIKTPRYGTGADYLTNIFSGSGNTMRIVNNTQGSVTAPTNGTPSPGFTFTTLHTGATTYYTKAFMVDTAKFYLQNKNIGNVAASTANTSGFTMTRIRSSGPGIFTLTKLQEITQVQTVAASSLADPGNPGKYWEFTSYNSGTLPFYVWYQITNETDPAVGGRTGIKINLVGTETAAQVAQITQESLNGFQVTNIETTAAASISAGAYFNLNSTGDAYYIWYKKDGAGTDPAVVGKIGILVEILTGDTNTQIASKTQLAMNMYSFASPDLRGYFLRGWNNGSIQDPDAATRWSMVPGVIGDVIGSFQIDDNLSHIHVYGPAFPTANAGGESSVNAATTNTTSITEPEGNKQNVPYNMYANYVILY